MVKDRQPSSESSTQSSMNESDRRLLLLAAVSRREQQLGTPPAAAEEEESSTALVSKDSPYKHDVTDAAATASKNIAAVGDVTEMNIKGAVATLPPTKRQLTSEAVVNAATANTTASADPTTFTLNDDEDIMVQLRRNGLGQIKIPPLYGPKQPLPPVTHTKKRKVSEGARDTSKNGGRLYSPSVASSSQAYHTGVFLPNIVTGGSNRQTASLPPLSTPYSYSASTDPTFGNMSQCQGSIQGRGGAASMQNWGHDYHQHIMSMSMAGLSFPHRMMLYKMMVQGDPQQGHHLHGLPPASSNLKGRESSKVAGEYGVHGLPQQQQIMQHRPKKQKLKASTKSPPKKKKKKDDIIIIPRRVQDEQKFSTTSTTPKEGNPIVFPNQEIYSQMLRKKEISSGSRPKKNPANVAASSGALTAQIVPNSEMERTRGAASSSQSAAAATRTSSSIQSATNVAAAPLTRWMPSLAVQRTELGSMYNDQEGELMVQRARLLQMEMALMHEEQQQELQKHLQQQQRLTQAESLERMSSSKIEQHHQHKKPPMLLPLTAAASRQITQDDPTRCLSQHNPNLQVQLSLLELENQLRAEEHARIIHSNQRRVAELHQQALQLEEQIKLREIEFIRERSRLVDMQTVNRLRIQADELEKRLMMHGDGDVEGFGRK